LDDQLLPHQEHRRSDRGFRRARRRLKKSLGVWSLIALGVGAVIGSGIFTVTGTAAAGEHFLAKSIFKAPVLDLLLNGGNASTLSGRLGAGPAISVSFVLVAIACGFAAICYAELASMIPIAGSAYTYSYATLGEIFAWIIGWDLILEYAFSNMSVAVGFSAYFNDLLDNLFISICRCSCRSRFSKKASAPARGSTFPALSC
jgi:basic amino acid/polyamine antiporter, APA family